MEKNSSLEKKEIITQEDIVKIVKVIFMIQLFILDKNCRKIS